MDYLFLIYANEAEVARSTPEETRAIMSRHDAIRKDAGARGVFRGANRLQSATIAVTARSSGGAATFTDGPFAETKETLGGYYLIDCAGSEDARYWADRIARTRPGLSVEFRPVFSAAAAGNA